MVRPETASFYRETLYPWISKLNFPSAFPFTKNLVNFKPEAMTQNNPCYKKTDLQEAVNPAVGVNPCRELTAGTEINQNWLTQSENQQKHFFFFKFISCLFKIIQTHTCQNARIHGSIKYLTSFIQARVKLSSNCILMPLALFFFSPWLLLDNANTYMFPLFFLFCFPSPIHTCKSTCLRG